MRTITLTEEDFQLLLIMCGYALGASWDQSDEKLSNSFIRLANEINKDNPNWTPYEIGGGNVQ